MRLLRSLRFARLTAALVVAAVLVGAIGAARGELSPRPHEPGSVYADWLRAQSEGVPGVDASAFEAALQAAVADAPTSFYGFLRQFVDVYEAHGVPAAEAFFPGADLTAAELILTLHSQSRQLAGDGPRPSAAWVATQTAASKPPPRLQSAGVEGPPSRPASSDPTRLAPARLAPPLVGLLRLLSAARPLGP